MKIASTFSIRNGNSSNSSKIFGKASYFQPSSRCLEMWPNTVFSIWYITWQQGKGPEKSFETWKFFSQPCNGINKNGRHCCLEHLKREAKESEERREARLYPVTIPRANARWDSIMIASHFYSAKLHSNSSNAHTRGNLSQKCTVCRYQMAPTLTTAVLFNSLPGSTVKTVFGFVYIGIRSCCSCDVSVSRTIPSRVGSNRVNRDCASSSPTSLELKFPWVLKFIEAYITNLL